MAKENIIDLSLGDPAFEFDEVVEYALENSRKRMSKYIINDPDYFYEGGSKDIANVIKYIAPSMVNYGFIDKKDEDRLPQKSLITGGGTSECFAYIMQVLAKDIKKQQKLGKKIIPTIVMPVPTYGFFMTVAREAGFNIAVVPRDMDKNGMLDSNRITNAFREIHERGLRIVGYYDCNPHNPTGLIRKEKETRMIAESIMEMNDYYDSLPDQWDGPASRIRIIDDLIGFGTEYKEIESAYSFMHIPECRRDTFLVLGLSKYGLAGLRAGYIMAKETDLVYLRKAQQLFTYFPPRPTIQCIKGYYNPDKSYQKRRIQHLKKLNITHEESGYIFKALVNGIDSMSELTKEAKQTVIDTISIFKNCSKDDALKFLNTPIPHIKIISTPESGLCHVLDMNALQGKTYRKHDNEDRITFKKSEDINTILREDHDLLLVPSDWLGCPPEDFIFRVNYSCSTKEIVKAVERLHEFIMSVEIH